MRAQGYSPFGASAEQDELLNEMISTAGPGMVGVFDLDGCLFDTRYRQITIFREFANRHQCWEIFAVKAEHFTDWDLKKPLQRIGLSDEKIEKLYPALRKYWGDCFFSDDYVRMDHAMPGALDVVEACYQRGMYIVYLTGRDHNMRRGTEEGLRANGFPYDKERTLLITKPEFKTQDSEYKKNALGTRAELGTPVLFADNEPVNVNVFKKAYPQSLTVFVETDHSFLKDRPDPSIPWIRSWYRSHWPKAESVRASIYL